jgi:hypothetical protein
MGCISNIIGSVKWICNQLCFVSPIQLIGTNLGIRVYDIIEERCICTWETEGKNKRRMSTAFLD